jgi:hypothetical protein
LIEHPFSKFIDDHTWSMDFVTDVQENKRRSGHLTSSMI